MKFKSLVKYGYHKAEMHSIMRPYNCVLCTEEFCIRQELYDHLLNHTDISNNSLNTTVICELCGIKLPTKEAYGQHIKSHSNIIADNEEDTEVSTIIENLSPNTLSQQAIESISLPPKTPSPTLDNLTNNFHCSECSKSFSTKIDLRKHIQLHRLQKYNCQKCAKTYHSNSVFEMHVRLCMPATDDVILVADEEIDSGPMLCTECNQFFENKKVLKFHQQYCMPSINNENNTIDTNLHSVNVKLENEDE